ncbi:MAG: hypothetical protein AAGA56_05550, partial [Myxococcota bacterium]
LEALPSCRTLEEAVSRHATFSRVLMLRRIDKSVSWWTGSASFRGQQPPARLLQWPSLRNVQIDEHAVDLIDLAADLPVEPERYLDVLGSWLASSPLTDIGTSHRSVPFFSWGRHTLAVISTVAGRNLAMRALSHSADDKPQVADQALLHLRGALELLPENTELAAQAVAFVDSIESVKDEWAIREGAR